MTRHPARTSYFCVLTASAREPRFAEFPFPAPFAQTYIVLPRYIGSNHIEQIRGVSSLLLDLIETPRFTAGRVLPAG